MGGKGGPLAFLNKKQWHPGNLKNMEEVWKREQKAAAEAKKAEELRKQIQEERQRESIMDVATAAGKVRKNERMDWMYQGGMLARQEADKRQEEQLLGKVAAEAGKQEEVTKVEAITQLPTFYAQATPASANEQWQRLNNDPLYLIKMQEKEALKKLKDNPIRMAALRQQVMGIVPPGKDKKSKKDKRHKQKKDKKQRKREKGGSVEERGDEEDEGPSRPERNRDEGPRHRHHHHSGRDGAAQLPHQDHNRVNYAHGEEPSRALQHTSHQRYEGEPSRSGHSRPGRQGRQHRPDGRDPPPSSSRKRDQNDYGGMARRGSKRGRRSVSAEPSSSDEARRRPHKSGRHYAPGDSDVRPAPAGNSPSDQTALRDHQHHSHNTTRNEFRGRDDCERNGEQDHGHEGERQRQKLPHARGRGNERGESRLGTGGGIGGYGLQVRGSRQDGVDNGVAKATRDRLQKAAEEHEAAEKARKEARYERREYQVGKLTDEERQQRLEAMQQAANQHEGRKWSRIQAAHTSTQNEEAKEAGRQRHSTDTLAFVQQAGKGALAEGRDLADTVGRRRFYNQRGRDL